MTTAYHTAIATGAAANASTFNAPLATLDAELVSLNTDVGTMTALTTTATNLVAAINELDADLNGAGGQAAAIAALQSVVVVNTTDITALEVEVAAARGGYGNLDARLDMLTAAGGNVATLTNGVANAAQKVVTVDSSTGFIDTAYVAYALVGGAIEYNQIDSIDSPTQITLVTNIGTGGIANDTYFAMISSAEYARLAAVDFTKAVFVDSAGSDANGALGRPDRAFATIDAALDELGAGGGAVYIGVGTFAPVTRAKVKAFTKFFGSGRPQSVGNTHLDGGTVIQGPLACFVDGVEFHDLGVDSGSNVCTALYAGVAQDGLDVAALVPNINTTVANVVISNVATICQSAGAGGHGMLVESAIGVSISDVDITFGLHGLALKAVNASLSNVRTNGNSKSVIIKCDATSACHDVSVAGLIMSSVGAGDGGGLFLSSNNSQWLHGINVSGSVADGTQYGVSFELYQGSGFRDINVDMAIDSPVVATVNLNALPFPDTVRVNGSPVAVQLVGASGNPAFENAWRSFTSGSTSVSFYKAHGRVYLAGHAICTDVTPPALGTTIFTLPAGYRPPANCRWPVCGSGTLASIAISAAGAVAYEAGDATGWISLDGSFWVGP